MRRRTAQSSSDRARRIAPRLYRARTPAQKRHARFLQARQTSRCWQSTRRIAFRNGVTTSDLNTRRSARCRPNWAACKQRLSRPRPTPQPAPIFCTNCFANRRPLFVHGFDRPNLRLAMRAKAGGRTQIARFRREPPRPERHRLLRVAPQDRGTRRRSCARAASMRCPITPAWRAPRARATRTLFCKRTAS